MKNLDDGPIYTNRVEDLLCLPANVYFLNKKCILLRCNHKTSELFNVDKVSDLIGMSYEDMAEAGNWYKGQGDSFKQDDMKVIVTGKPVYNRKEPLVYDKLGNPRYYLSSRLPVKNRNNKLIGVVGISFDVTTQELLKEFSVFQNLSVFMQTGFHSKKKFKLLGVELSSCEARVLYHLLRGKTAGETAAIVYRSQKTVQTHIASIKEKLKVKTKSELIEKILNGF